MREVRGWKLGLLSIAVVTLVAPLPDPAASGGKAAGVAWTASPLQAQEARGEPIAYTGHGAFFARGGRQIVPTPEWVSEAQDWYRDRLLSGLDDATKAEFATFERRLGEGLRRSGQDGLVLRQRGLEWLLAHSARTAVEGRMQGKLRALGVFLNWQLPRRDDLEELRSLEPFALDPGVASRLRQPEFHPGEPILPLVTTNSGAAYTAECAGWDVPIPPSIGDLSAGAWTSVGFIPPAEQFIVGTPAEVRVFENADGMCIALPRYTGVSLTTVMLDGVICLSKITSKVCFWDNQMGGVGFNFAAGAQIPIGVPNLAVDPMGRYQAGGAEIEFGSGDVCTDCHAGENPYIIHPISDLGGGVLMGDLADPPFNLPMFAPNRYDPIVGATWPQNALSHSQPLVPAACTGCHSAAGSGGRFPHLSDDLPGYCGTILAQARTDTMPLGSPGSVSLATLTPNFIEFCDDDPSTGPSDRGDPHLTTTNGIRYDFQSAGEFTALRNSDTGFELQTRQTPVLTTWTPGPCPHTGLASCPSLNTAAALRVGSRRISYQPLRGSAEEMVLRIDGAPVTLPASGALNLGGGNKIARAVAGGGIDVQAADGTRVIVTPNYWASEGYWYLDVEVLNTPAREGTIGHISAWLPAAPDGTSFGPMPPGLLARHNLLNHTFADAWRVKPSTSLFDYDPGTSTATFTEPGWPPPPGVPCTSIPSNPWPGGEERRPVTGFKLEVAKSYCQVVRDPEVFQDCVFDLQATGNAEMAQGYATTLELRESTNPGF